MLIAKKSAAIANLSGDIFVIGGRGYNRAALSSVESYNEISNRWTSLAPMNKNRTGASAAIVNGELYVVGGWNGKRKQSTIERYDRHANKWSIVSSAK